MNLQHLSLAAASLSLLFACGGGDSGTASSGGTTITGSGTLFPGVELPQGDDLFDLTPAQQTLVNEWATLNTNSLPTTLTATGTARYTGQAIMGLTEAATGEESIVDGDITLDADFGAGTIGGRLDDLSILESDGSLNILASSEALPITNGTISGARYRADMDGTLGYSGGTVTVDSTIDGAFITSGAVVTLGEINGTVDVFGSSTETLRGIFTAD